MEASHNATINIDSMVSEIQNVVGNITESDSNIFEHMRKNSLISKIQRLIKIDNILNYQKYKLVFIGTIGTGKTTAICHLFDLVNEVEKQIEVNKKKISAKVTEPLLSTGSGRTTISEVVITSGDKNSISIDPVGKEALVQLIEDFCSSFYEKNQEGEVISVEIERALRSITNLKKKQIKVKTESGEAQSRTVDPAKEFSIEMDYPEFFKLAIENSDLDKRIFSKESSILECPHDVDPRLWLNEMFEKVNKAEIENFSIPKKIYITVKSDSDFSSYLERFSSVIDTKGIDEIAIRPDLKEYIESEDTICIFTSSYNDAPEANIRELMKHFMSKKSKKLEDRFVTLILPHKGEPENENDGDGTRETGIEIKKQIVLDIFKNLQYNIHKDNIILYDALQFFDQKGRLDRDADMDEVQEVKIDIINSLCQIIEKRKENLYREVDIIYRSFQDLLTEKKFTGAEVDLIERAINKLNDQQYLEKRVPSFVYEEFIENYIDYYSSNYKAWNTKDAIHRRLGTFKERDFDTYFDAKVIAEGLDDDAMLKKFTKEIKNDVIQIIKDLGDNVDDIKTLTPEIIKRFEIQYEAFIDSVGTLIEDYLRKSNENHSFWRDLIDRRGKGAGYNQDVCTILRRKLEGLNVGVSANRLLQEYAEKEWRKTINIVLDFFVMK